MSKKTSKSPAQGWINVCFMAVALLMASSLAAYAQGESVPCPECPFPIHIRGTVRNCAGVPLPGIAVHIQGENGNSADAITNASGQYNVILPSDDIYTATPVPTTGVFFSPQSSGAFNANFTRYPRDNRANFDGDCKTDISVFNDGIWNSVNSSNGVFVNFNFGLADDVITPGDYNADGKTDYAVFRRTDGNWYIDTDPSTPLTFDVVHFGISRDIPVARDYDGDGKTDIAVFRPSASMWYILNSSNNSVSYIQWGLLGDRVTPGDYDGDNKDDVAVFRPSDNVWYILQSSNGALSAIQWGANGDVPVQADYDGDGRTDVAVYRPSTQQWFIRKSSDGSLQSAQWGLSTDIKVPGDYDGDGKADVAVQRPDTGVWYIIYSTGGGNAIGFFGGFPVPAGYLAAQ